jgi:photosystem II stability/assembly factor-like uncharacterized protein
MRIRSVLPLSVAIPSVSLAAPEWTLQSPLPTSADLRGVCMVGSAETWAVGSAGEILHTGDGGATGNRQLADSSTPGVAGP